MCGFCEKKLPKYYRLTRLRAEILLDKDTQLKITLYFMLKKTTLYIQFRFDFVYDIHFIETVVQFGFH